MTREQLIAGRALSGLTWDELCKRAGTTRNTTWRWITGKHTICGCPVGYTVESLRRVLEAEGVVFYPPEADKPATVGWCNGPKT